MTQGKLEGLVALVTGASTGIGKATAISLSKEGAKVVIAARGEDKLKEVADEITSAGGEAVVVAGDIFKEADCKMMVDTAVEKFGALHVAFNNTGVFETATFADMTKDSVDSLPDNAKSLARCFKYQGAPSGVRVNSVRPGHVQTPGYGDMPVETLDAITKTDQLIARPIQPEEIAKVVIFLASEDAAMVTSSSYVMDGGFAIKA